MDALSMNSHVTPEFVVAVKAGARALRDQADEVSRDRLFMGSDSVAVLLHQAVERYRQQAALLEDWCKRSTSGGTNCG
jgi:hypothetical protein